MNTLLEQIATLEASLPGLHTALGTATVAALADQSRQSEADQALAAHREASDRLEQLRAALPLIEAKEAADAAAKEQTKREKARDKLQAEWERLMALAAREEEKSEAAGAKLPEAQAELDEIARQWRNAKVKVDVITAQRDDAKHHYDECMEQVDAIEMEIEAFPITAEDVAAAAAEADRAAAAEAYADETVEADAPYELVQSNPVKWCRTRTGHTIQIKRRDLAAHNLEQGRARQWHDKNVAPFEQAAAAERAKEEARRRDNELVSTGRTRKWEKDRRGKFTCCDNSPDFYTVERCRLPAWLAEQDAIIAEIAALDQANAAVANQYANGSH